MEVRGFLELRPRAGLPTTLAVTLALVAVFLVATLPLAEFQNACDFGRPLLVETGGNC